jgi:glutamate dehydrogenase/leucine dehydrogenase
VVWKAAQRKITNQELLELKCDILVPAALEMQINKDNVAVFSAASWRRANGPTTLEADAALRKERFLDSRYLGQRGRRGGFLLRMGAGLAELLLD